MEYRLYSFAHSWLSPIQKGIQTQHATVKLLRNHSRKAKASIQQWADKDQTTIILECGGSHALEDKYNIFNELTDFPCQIFYEDQESLSGAPTAVVVILPDWFYNSTMEDYKDLLPIDLWDIFRMVNESRLAV